MSEIRTTIIVIASSPSLELGLKLELELERAATNKNNAQNLTLAKLVVHAAIG